MVEVDTIYWQIRVRGRILRLLRTPTAYISPTQARDCHIELDERVHALGLERARTGLLVDLRAGPQITDPTFEEAIREVRRRIFAGFGACAVLVRTLSGKLQLHRLERSDRLYRTFDDEDEALAFLEAALDGTLSD